jgi:hypothetical protein
MPAHGQTGVKRESQQREVDLIETAERYLRGDSHELIAQYITDNRPYRLSRQTISNDIAELHRRWLHAQLIDYNEAKARELQRIDKLEMSYWDGWERSLEKQEEIESFRKEDEQVSGDGSSKPAYKQSKVTKKEKTHWGDIRFLDGVMKCTQERAKILGLYAPDKSKIEVNWREEAKAAGVDPDQMENKLVEEFLTAAASGVDGPGVSDGMGESPENNS